MRLRSPPYLQIALDMVEETDFNDVIRNIPESTKILIEAGTPLIKKFGISIIGKIRSSHPQAYIVADMKTLDVGALEVKIAADANADAVAISGLAAKETIESALEEGDIRSVDIILDLMSLEKPLKKLQSLSKIPDVLLMHRGIDQEGRLDHSWDLLEEIKNKAPNSLIALAGGLEIENSKKAIENGADIIVIGRAITQSSNIEDEIKRFLDLL